MAQPLPKLKPRTTMHTIWGQVVPAILAVTVFSIIGLAYFGIIDLPHISFDDNNDGVYDVPIYATVGEQYSYDFSKELIPLLPPESHSDPEIYSFYLDSGVGFPPMGLTLGIDGVLSGIPTGKSSTFRVCVKDAGGRSACRTYNLYVNPKDDSQPDDDTDNDGYTCPTTSCGTGSCCGATGETEYGDFGEEITPAVSGVLVRDFCECPSDTVDSGFIDRTAPGGPWKLCHCKNTGV